MKPRYAWYIGLILVLALILVACGGAEDPTATAVPEVEVEEPAPEAEEPEAEEPVVEEEEAMDEAMALSLWYHGAGNPEEREVILQIIDDFNASQGDYAVEIEEFPQATYNESIVAAALAGDLPDIIDMDGPVMPNWAWSGYLQPLSLASGALDGFLPGALGNGMARSIRSACGTPPRRCTPAARSLRTTVSGSPLSTSPGRAMSSAPL